MSLESIHKALSEMDEDANRGTLGAAAECVEHLPKLIKALRVAVTYLDMVSGLTKSSKPEQALIEISSILSETPNG